MSIGSYIIWIDGEAYRGESEATEPAPSLSGGWYDRGPETVSGIAIGGGDPYRIEGRRNLQSHIDRILRRVGTNGFLPEQISIEMLGTRQEGFCQKCEHPTWGAPRCPNCRTPTPEEP